MEPYERQAFDMFVSLAVERFCERIVQRNGGVERALARLREDPDGEGVWLGRFVEAFFRENALDNPGGACLVLRALERWEAPKTGAGRIGEVLQQMAQAAFARLVGRKAEEVLERGLVYGGEE